MKQKPLSDRVNLAKLQNILQIISMLKASRWTVKQLMERFDLSRSSLYRYIDLLNDAGFCLENDFHDRYFIVTTEDDPLQSQFTIDEMVMLRALVQADASHPLMGSVLKKLALHSEIDMMPRLFLKAHLGNLVEQLTHAMRNKHQVVLKNYHSANSSGVRHRHVEPIHFGDNYGTIHALDLHDLTCKQFKLDRIGEITETHSLYEHEHLHKQRPTDAFGLAGTGTTTVTLTLSARAFLLMREEFPMSLPCLTTHGGRYIFQGPVVTFAGVGRFVMGLIDEIEIVSPEEFKQYVIKKMESTPRANPQK